MVTTIQLDNEVKAKLDRLKMYSRETYNDLLLRLIKGLKEVNRESLMATIEVLSDPETMRDIAKALEEYEKKGGKTLEQIEKELDL